MLHAAHLSHIKKMFNVKVFASLFLQSTGNNLDIMGNFQIDYSTKCFSLDRILQCSYTSEFSLNTFCYHLHHSYLSVFHISHVFIIIIIIIGNGIISMFQPIFREPHILRRRSGEFLINLATIFSVMNFATIIIWLK